MSDGILNATRVRDAEARDAAVIAELLGQLGYPSEPGLAWERTTAATADGRGRVIVAEVDGTVKAVTSIFHIRTIHRPGDICRITALVVHAEARGLGLGRRLVEEIERHARATGCPRVEVTSAGQRTGAHDFYWRLGYTEHPKRFIKDL